jgi:hypothetical protein
MPRDEKAVVHITNRPSDKDRHTKQEWADAIQLRESFETIRDIRDTREKLGRLTIREFADTFCYDSPDLRAHILSQLDGDELIRDMKIDSKTLRKLADKVGGERARAVVQRHQELREIEAEKPKAIEAQPAKDVSQQQVELLRALLKTMDPEVVKRALTGE